MSVTRIRVVLQTFFLLIFFLFVGVTWQDKLKGWPVSLYLELDPLVGAGTSLATGHLYHPVPWYLPGLLFGLVLFVSTLLLGRVFCSWMCPFGVVHHFIGWLFNTRNVEKRIQANRYRRSQEVKYLVLFFVLVAALLGSLQTGLLDPISFLHRSISVSVLPLVDALSRSLGAPVASPTRPHLYDLGWVIGFLFLLVVGINIVRPRFFCRILCPLGALLGCISHFALFRIDRDPEKCNDCGLCLERCEGASDPHTRVRKAECVMCLACREDCPQDAIRFGFVPPAERAVSLPDLRARRAFLASAAGLLLPPIARRSGETTRGFDPAVIRPPGSVEEVEFLKRCIKCGQCMRVCPTNVLQPALFSAGLEGIWTPLLNMRMGWCEYDCTLCSQVCPTGAIRRITAGQKHGTEEFLGGRRPIRIGTAFYDRGRCLPWAMDIPCVVCEENCPTSPKAVFTREVHQPVRAASGLETLPVASAAGSTIATEGRPWEPGIFARHSGYHVEIVAGPGKGARRRIRSNSEDAITLDADGPWEATPTRESRFRVVVRLQQPYVDPILCIGCGICEYVCPVRGQRAVRVTADGETRSRGFPSDRDRGLLLKDT